jgi:hypothetical protein
MRRVAAAALTPALACVVVITGGQAKAASSTTEAIAVWQERRAGGDWNIGYGVVGRDEPDAPASGLRWQTTGTVASRAGDDENPAVALRPGTTDAIAVWQHGDIQWSRFTDDGWTPPSPVVAIDGEDVDPAIAIDDDGTALAVWVHRDGAAASLWSARWDGASWTTAAALPGPFVRPSIPEIAYTGAHAALVAFSDVAAGVHRAHTARWDGGAWSVSEPVPLAADQQLLMPEHGWGDYDVPQGAFTRLSVVAEADGAAQVLWGSPVTEDITTRYDAVGVMGERRNSDGSWSALRNDRGRPFVGTGICHSPAAAMTGSHDVVGLYTSEGSFEHSRSVRGIWGDEATSYDTSYDDVRAAVAPVAGRVVAVATGLPHFGEDPPRPSVITWSLGTLRPQSPTTAAGVTWSTPHALDIDGEARYPAVASVLGGTQNPLVPRMIGRGYAAGGPAGMVLDTGTVSSTGSGRSETAAGTVRVQNIRGDDASTTIVDVDEIALPTEPRLILRGVRVTAEASCALGRWGEMSIASIQSGDGPPTPIDARDNMSVPLGVFVLHINEKTLWPLGSQVIGVRLTGPGVDIVAAFARAELGGCVGNELPAGSSDHEH